MPETDKYDPILNPKGTFERPTLEQIRKHKNKYLGLPTKTAKVNPRNKKINDTNSLA